MMDTSQISSTMFIERCFLEFKTLPSEKVLIFAKSINQNIELIEEFFTLFNTDHINYEQIDTICSQFLLFLRSEYIELQIFTMQFIPIFILRYLTSLSILSYKNLNGIETFLLATYNLIINNESNSNILLEDAFIPSLNSSSVYHNPPEFDFFKMSELNLNASSNKLQGPFVVANLEDNFTSTNRSLILTTLMCKYNSNISQMCSSSHLSIFNLCNRLTNLDEKYTRLVFDPSLIIEILAGIYFIMFNGLYVESMESIKLAHERACYELSPQLMLVTNAYLNSGIIRRDELDGDVTAQALISFQETFSPVNSMHAHPITSSSFKIHKLPDDIEITGGELENDINDNNIRSPKNLESVYLYSTSTSIPPNLLHQINNNNEGMKPYKSSKKSRQNFFSNLSIKEEEKKINKDIFNNKPSMSGDANKVSFLPLKNIEIKRNDKNSKVSRSKSSIDTSSQKNTRKNSLNIITEF